MSFTTHQLAQYILSRPNVTLDEQSGQGLGHKQPVTMEDGCRIWMKFYPPAQGKGATAPATKAPEAVAAAIAPRVKRSKAPEAAKPAPAAPAAPVAAKAPEKAPQTELEAMKAGQAALEAKLSALMKALGV